MLRAELPPAGSAESAGPGQGSASSAANRVVEDRREPIAVVVNPVARAASFTQRAIDRWGDAVSAVIETHAGSGNSERVAELIARVDPAIVVAAGGDGTVSAVAEGIRLAGRCASPVLGLLPTGTANNVARSFGLRSIRPTNAALALELATSAVLGAAERTIDLGRVNGRHFVSACAVGLDADILCTRNLLRRRSRLARRFDGYSLYLWSWAVNVARDHHGAGVRLLLDGVPRNGYAYNLLFTNTPLYAGEFRFDGDGAADDGLLDLHVFDGPLSYLRRLPAAWVRHLQHGRGRPVRPPAGFDRVRQVTVELDAPVRCQLDGEELGSEASYEVRVVPGALTVRVPRPPASSPRQ